MENRRKQRYEEINCKRVQPHILLLSLFNVVFIKHRSSALIAFETNLLRGLYTVQVHSEIITDLNYVHVTQYPYAIGSERCGISSVCFFLSL